MPRQLPADVRGFVHRAQELGQLDAAPADRDGTPFAASVHVVAGTAGAGKTSLALHWAHRVKDRFPDGQLFMNLRGDDLGEPVTPEQALRGFLRALGVPAAEVPGEPEAAAALYRSLLAERRVLVLLDNAASAGQVRPLLPGGGDSLVLVTSRSRLSGLAVRDGARRVTLGTLPEAEAVDLLRTATADRRPADDPEPLAELAVLCARLPLALRIAAERAASRPETGLAELTAGLRAESAPREAPASGEDEADAVCTVFAWSYRALPAPTARVFRLLGLHPDAEFGPHAAAALGGLPVGRAAELLDDLVGAHLLERTAADRYQLHDLLRAYAAERALAEESGDERRAALRRVLDWYLHTADAARALMGPARRPAGSAGPVGRSAGSAGTVGRSAGPAGTAGSAGPVGESAGLVGPAGETVASADVVGESVGLEGPAPQTGELDAPTTAVPPLEFADSAAAAAWTEREHVVLPALVRTAAAAGLDRLAWQLAETLGHAQPPSAAPLEWTAVGHLGLEAAERADDTAARIRLLIALGAAYRRGGRCEPGLESLRRALALARETGRRLDEARALDLIGEIHLFARRLDLAAEHFAAAGELFRALDARRLAARSLAHAARTHLDAGRLAEAEEAVAAALAAHRDLDDRQGVGNALWLRAALRLEQDRAEDARAAIDQALEIALSLRDHRLEGGWLLTLGDVQRVTGAHDDALASCRRSATLHQRLGDRGREALAWRGTARTYAAMGRPAEAVDLHRRAAAVYAELDDGWERAVELDLLATALHPKDPAAAAAHWAEALTGLSPYRDPRAADVRARVEQRLTV